MNNEYYGAPTRPNDDFLAHYGIKGMKWGVRKAVSSGSDRRLSRQYAKASKKLAKLEKRAASGKKYAKRAALLGTGAAAAGGLAAVGTEGVSKAIGYGGKAFSKGANAAGGLLTKAGGAMTKHGIRGGKHNASGVAGRVADWGNSDSVSRAVRKPLVTAAATKSGTVGNAANKANSALRGVSNNTIARIGAAGIGAGLAAGAGYNAYRAATTKRAARKAAQFRSEMNKAFAGTKYANGAPRHQGTQKKKKR